MPRVEPRRGTIAPLDVPLTRGPFQNNGATPWYALIAMGTPGQTMKISLDTGSNFIWCTSCLCGGGCKHYGGDQFNQAASATFEWVDPTPHEVSFGPWGTMTVETGADDFTLSDHARVFSPLFVSSAYAGEQFEELDWDGGIGIPSGSAYAAPGIPDLISTLMNHGLVDPAMPYLSFVTDTASGVGLARIGGYDPDAFDPCSGIFMRWSPCSELPGLEYLWSTALFRYQVGDSVLATNVLFCLDTGSSQFKGDGGIMQGTLDLVCDRSQPPDVTLVTGSTSDGTEGVIVVPPSVYEVRIQAGTEERQVIPQFRTLEGLDGLVVVGSVLMDHLYTVYQYAVSRSSGRYSLSPVGMWLFNKRGGPEIIRSRAKNPVTLGPRSVRFT